MKSGNSGLVQNSNITRVGKFFLKHEVLNIKMK